MLECRNNVSARSQCKIVGDLIKRECENGFMYGPFDSPPFDNNRVSPLGVAEGKYSKKKLLILDLSSPHQSEKHCSINDLIDKDTCSMSYVKIDDAIEIHGCVNMILVMHLLIVPLLLLNGVCFALNGIRYIIFMFV